MGDRSTLNLISSAVSGENVGGACGVFKDKTVGNNLRYYTLSGGSNTTLTTKDGGPVASGSYVKEYLEGYLGVGTVEIIMNF